MKIRPLGTELFHTDGGTDMMELIIDFRNLRTRLEIQNPATLIYKISENLPVCS